MYQMTEFDCAQSNSLLKQNIGQPPPKEEISRARTNEFSRMEQDLVNVPKKNPTTELNDILTLEKTCTRTPPRTPPLSESASDSRPSCININEQREKESTRGTGKTIPTKRTGRSKFERKGNKTGQRKFPKEAKQSRSRKARRSVPDEKEFIPEEEQPSHSDIVGGRGGRSNHHPGNRPYWIRILESRKEYQNCRSDNDKSRIANGILRYVRHTLRGRFLNIDNATKRWYILPETIVLDKIKQALRDKYVPYWAKDLEIEDKVYDYGDLRRKQAKTTIGMKSTNFNAQLRYQGGFAHENSATFPRFEVGTPSSMLADSNGIHRGANKLDFLFNSERTKRPTRHTPVIPTVDDILKRKVDRMPSFSTMTRSMRSPSFAAATFPNFAMGANPLQSTHLTQYPSSWRSTMGGGIGDAYGSSGIFGDSSHGFVASGNPGAPALPGTMMGRYPPSLSLLHSLDMSSLDSYLDHQLSRGMPWGATAFARNNAADAKTIDLLNSLAGSSSSLSSSSAFSFSMSNEGKTKPGTAGSTKTDWNAMYARALSNNKPK